MPEINMEKLIDFQMVHLDRVGNIYEYQGKIIRIINDKFKQQTRKLLEKDGLVEKLVKNNLFIDTKISELSCPNGNIVLEHRKIGVKQHYSQWTFEMMKDAALLVLKINEVCSQYGYELKDCHQGNIMFDGTTPIWVDFGSIVKRQEKEQWVAKKEFIKYYYLPLVLWSKGYDGIVNSLYRASENLNLEELLSINYHIPLKVVRKSLNMLDSKWFSFQYIIETIRNLDTKKQSYWGKYQDSYWNRSNKRFDYEVNWIKSHNKDIETMVEIGANQGFFSYLVAEQTAIKQIISTDYDSEAVNVMYKKIKAEEIKKITPLVLDFVWTSCEQLKNYQSDLLVANALTHHLLLTQGLTMKAMLDKFSALTNKYVIVEFMPRGVNDSHLPNWYTKKWFLESFNERFELIEIKNISRGRIMIIGLKK
ncbi:MAG: hypothetical protein ACI4E5_00170 [Suilimivivens sp.]